VRRASCFHRRLHRLAGAKRRQIRRLNHSKKEVESVVESVAMEAALEVMAGEDAATARMQVAKRDSLAPAAAPTEPGHHEAA
jgi:hypothetical protein